MRNFTRAFALVSLIGLAACGTLTGNGTGLSNPRTDLATAETVTGTAQQWWIDNCVTAQNFAYCTDAQTKATVKGASATATAAFQTATDAALAKTLDAQTIAALVTDAVNDANTFAAVIASLKTKK